MIKVPSQGLLLNPRAPSEVSAAQISAWNQFEKEFPTMFANAVGISTSGSTSGGIGSIIVLSRMALEASALAVNRRFEAKVSDVWGLALPIFHVGGYSIPLRAGLSGSQVANFEADWNPIDFHRWLTIEKVSLLSLVPTQLFDLVKAGLSAPSLLRAVIVGGGRLDESLHTRACSLGWPVVQSYGLTECSSQVATATLADGGRQLEVLDHVDVRSDENKKLWIRSVSLLSARIIFDRGLLPSIEHPLMDGWFETTDLAEISRIGFSDGVRDVLKILGRDGETVKVVGELVDLVRVLSELEKLVSKYRELESLSRRISVVAIPHLRRGHELVLVLETADASNETLNEAIKQLVSHMGQVLAPFERPTRILRVEKIPRSSLGKVLSSLLTDQALKRAIDLR